MRSFRKFPVGPDILTLLAVLAMAGVVYLCALPGTFQFLSTRHAGAAELMGQAREHIVKEGSLFTSLVHAADDTAAAKLRQQLVDNERAFHDVASEVASDLPEAKTKIETMVNRFDHMAASGWRAAAMAPQSTPEARETLLEGVFAESLEELRQQSERMELELHGQS
jgi:hypothetical protein